MSEEIAILMLKGMEDLGASYIEHDDDFIYFEAKQGAEILNERKLNSAKRVFNRILGLEIKILDGNI